MNDVIPNIKFYHDFLDTQSAEELFLYLIAQTDWNKQMATRYTASFGVPYFYSGMTYNIIEMPTKIRQIASTISELLELDINNCLLNYYLNGNSKMGYHSDDTSQLACGTGVAIVSLGATREMCFKYKQDNTHTYQQLLTSGSLLYMDDSVQQHWLHAIPKCETDKGRISLTFRQINKKTAQI
ncbi:alpha-ketoglutarate-dependent dioxygenase AlkB [Psychrobacter sp. I-STPA6b]|uniref:alpha-ketoglutarate-dependent dioxygenase AlkB n=1 Tax=Psychrobacter sp. I-STPA6b TaxID=2585718 RepID=UPI001D0BF606|nr:alpha-ketoglutarate-dependent dioxygenase AlkB [Psychrobacter sp. I-STPA6b]